MTDTEIPSLEKLIAFIYEGLQAIYQMEDFTGESNESDIVKNTYESADGKWQMSDIIYGSEPFAGTTIVLCNGEVCWAMHYYGGVAADAMDSTDDIYDSLKEALLQAPKQKPMRGPILSPVRSENGLEYFNDCSGNVSDFSGWETISSPSRELFRVHYLGGRTSRWKSVVNKE